MTIVDRARAASEQLARLSVAERVRPVRRLRRAIAADPSSWAEAIQPPQDRTHAESLAAEVGPLADACAWLEKNASRTLRDRRPKSWFGSVSLRVARKPHGVVLVIGASNYPLFLLAIPAIQALVAGNAVLLKPAPGSELVCEMLVSTLVDGGVDAAACVALASSTHAATAAIDEGVDHVVATGSASTGRAIARRAAESLAPTTLECSGVDAVVVLPSANLVRVAACVAWGLTFNSGATCIAPRRVVCLASQRDELLGKLTKHLLAAQPRRIAQRSADDLQKHVTQAIREGASLASPSGFDLPKLEKACEERCVPPIVLVAGEHRPSILDADVFAPVVTVVTANTVSGLVEAANDCPFALGASVFGSPHEANEAARGLRAGCVTINDLIAPTGDARVPFGGAGQSGHGVTRGAEGLLAMTRAQALLRRHGSWLPHLDEPTAALHDLLTGMIQARHGSGVGAKIRGLRTLVAAAQQHKKQSKPKA